MTDLVYILSPSYSGSTLLTFLLGTHPRVATIGELKATARGDIERYQCSCGERMLDCRFWQALREDVTGAGVDLNLHDLGTHFSFPEHKLGNKVLRTPYRGGSFERVRRAMLKGMPGWRTRLADIVKRNRILIDAITRLQGGTMFLDGSKDATRLRYLLDAGLWRIKAIHLTRDGRGSVSSYMRAHKLSLEDASREWRGVQTECDRIARELGPDACISIRYEELCRAPDATLERVFRYLGLEPQDATQDFLAIEHHILGHGMRLRTNGQIALNENWKHTWTQAELTTFEQIAGDVNRRNGYPPITVRTLDRQPARVLEQRLRAR